MEGKTGWEGEGGAGGNFADNWATWYWPGPGAETYWDPTYLTDVVNLGTGSADDVECVWTFNGAGLSYINSVLGSGYLELVGVAQRDADNQFSDSCNMQFHSERSSETEHHPILDLVLQEPT